MMNAQRRCLVVMGLVLVTVSAAGARGGLTVRTLFDRARAVPDDIVTLTVVCRNDGPLGESNVRVTQPLPAGLEMVPQPLDTGARFDGEARSVEWQMTDLPADSDRALSFQAKVVADAPGTALQAVAEVRSQRQADAQPGTPATAQVVGPPLLAAFALPDVMIAQDALPKPLIDVGAAPGEALTQRLVGLGVVNGFPDGTFRPGDNVTRAQATKMLVAVQQLAGLRDRVGVNLALSRPATVTVTMVDSHHQTVRKLADHWTLPSGAHQVIWNGRDDAGKALPVGVYRYELVALDADGVEQHLDGTVNVITVQPLPLQAASSFSDVPKGAWYQPYVAAAERSGLVKGYPGGLFEPKTPITRVEHTAMVVRAAGLTAEAEKRMNDSLGFSDAKDVPKWAVGYVAVATANSADGDGRLYAVGYKENCFDPQHTLTRGEAAAVLDQLLDREGATTLPASGRVARGHEVHIDGVAVAVGDTGRFRQAVTLRSGEVSPNVVAH